MEKELGVTDARRLLPRIPGEVRYRGDSYILVKHGESATPTCWSWGLPRHTHPTPERVPGVAQGGGSIGAGVMPELERLLAPLGRMDHPLPAMPPPSHLDARPAPSAYCTQSRVPA